MRPPWGRAGGRSGNTGVVRTVATCMVYEVKKSKGSEHVLEREMATYRQRFADSRYQCHADGVVNCYSV